MKFADHHIYTTQHSRYDSLLAVVKFKLYFFCFHCENATQRQPTEWVNENEKKENPLSFVLPEHAWIMTHLIESVPMALHLVSMMWSLFLVLSQCRMNLLLWINGHFVFVGASSTQKIVHWKNDHKRTGTAPRYFGYKYSTIAIIYNSEQYLR